MTACGGQPGVAGDQWRHQYFAEGHEGGIVGRQIVAKLPDSVGQRRVRITNDRQIPEVASGVGGPVLSKATGCDQAPEGMKEFDVDQVWCVKILVGG